MSPSTPLPLVLVATSGAVSELVGIVSSPRAGQPAYEIVAIVGGGAGGGALPGESDAGGAGGAAPGGTADLLAEIARRLGVPYVGDLAGAEVPAGASVAISAGDHRFHQQMVRLAADRGLQPATLIHADTTIGPWVTIGQGCVVSPGVRITGNVVVGDHCQLHTGSILSHDDVLGDFVTISPATTLCGGVTVGARSTVFAGSTVMPGVTIGCDATVGAGALVNRDVADGTTVVGVPARPLGARSSA